MSVIGPCVYVDGELMAPGLRATLDAQSRLALKSGKFFPTFDIGFYHIFRVIAYGRSYQEAEAEVLRKMRRFYRKMNQVEGFSTLKLDKRRGFIPVNENYEITYDITYVIERTGSRSQNSESPYPEYQQDLRKLTFTPETAAVLTGR